ncbi:hypothetical protein [Synechococcus sp. PCC 7336]|uniref:hypothetical protein n=1 Tax=Synechococcus sp. PCC 7336 TaxID=195250 RepID=UPI000345139D|nr:hypothetical protein [Synechococcus sp. PCC 7336]
MTEENQKEIQLVLEGDELNYSLRQDENLGESLQVDNDNQNLATFDDKNSTDEMIDLDPAENINNGKSINLFGAVASKVNRITGGFSPQSVLNNTSNLAEKTTIQGSRLIDKTQKSNIVQSVRNLTQKTAIKLDNPLTQVKENSVIKQAGEVLGKALPYTAAMLSYANQTVISLKDMPQAWQNTFYSRMRSHGINPEQAFDASPEALRRLNAEAIADWFKQKDWSHIKSQKEHPDLADDLKNAIWEDSSPNKSRGASEMTGQEKLIAHLDNRLDFLTDRRFWDRAFKGALKAAVITIIIKFVDEVLIHRDELLNGTAEERKKCLVEIAKDTGFAGLSGVVIFFVITVLSVAVPGMGLAFTVLSGPMTVMGSAMLAGRLINSYINNPTEQEQQFFTDMKAKFLAYLDEASSSDTELNALPDAIDDPDLKLLRPGVA